MSLGPCELFRPSFQCRDRRLADILFNRRDVVFRLQCSLTLTASCTVVDWPYFEVLSAVLLILLIVILIVSLQLRRISTTIHLSTRCDVSPSNEVQVAVAHFTLADSTSIIVDGTPTLLLVTITKDRGQ